MAFRSPTAIAVILLVGSGFVATTIPASAQDTNTTSKVQTTAPEETQSETFSAQDRAAFLDARIAALHAGLQLTQDQETHWKPVESALRDFFTLAAAQRQKFHEAKHPMDPVARLQMRSENMVARGQALKKVADAAAPLYSALSDSQKHRLPILIRGVFHPFGYHGRCMLGLMGRGMMGRGMMGRGMMGQGMMGRGMMGDGMGRGMMGAPDEDEESK